MLVERTRSSKNRPLNSGVDPREVLETLMLERDPSSRRGGYRF